MHDIEAATNLAGIVGGVVGGVAFIFRSLADKRFFQRNNASNLDLSKLTSPDSEIGRKYDLHSTLIGILSILGGALFGAAIPRVLAFLSDIPHILPK